MAAAIETNAVDMLKVFEWLQTEARLDGRHEMYRTFNCGIGMIVVTSAADAPAVIASLGSDAKVVGSLTERGSGGAVQLGGSPS